MRRTCHLPEVKPLAHAARLRFVRTAFAAVWGPDLHVAVLEYVV
jgi:hypothetical protein